MVRQFAHFGWWLSMVWLGTAGLLPGASRGANYR